MTTDIGAVADELYGLPAGEFTAARDRAAAVARQAGDREVAATIKKLRRPTVSAWAVNRLARDQADEVTRLLDAGAALRQAQANLDAEELRRLTQEGQHLVGDLARQARQAAGDAGQAVSEAAYRELEATLHAALADPEAGEAVRSGRLTRPLQYSGFGPVDVADAVAVGPGRGPQAPLAPSPPGDASPRAGVRPGLRPAGAGSSQRGAVAGRGGGRRRHPPGG